MFGSELFYVKVSITTNYSARLIVCLAIYLTLKLLVMQDIHISSRVISMRLLESEEIGMFILKTMSKYLKAQSHNFGVSFYSGKC